MCIFRPEKGMEMKEAYCGKAEEALTERIRREREDFYVGGPAGACQPAPPPQLSSAQSVLESMCMLREKVRDIRELVSGKLGPISKPPGPIGCEELNQRELPPYFNELREIIMSTDDMLNVIRDCIHRVDI